MKVLLLTQWFDPEPTFKGLAFAKELKRQGIDVDVITGFPNYPGGKVYDGYAIKAYQKEIIDNVDINRVPIYPDHGKSAIKRIFNYLSFFFSSSLYGIFRRKKVDVIYAYHPPLTTALSASLISLIRRTPFVIDVQDLWPDTLAATGMLNNTKILKVVDIVCHFIYKRASKIIVLSPGFKKTLIERGVPDDKIEIIYNWCDEEKIRNFEKSEHLLPNNGFNVVFAGNLGLAQGLPAIVDTAKLLIERKIKANIVIIGSGIAKIEAEQKAEDLELDNIYFIPRVPVSQVGDLLNQADALLVHLIDDELFKITIPSRTQAYMACGKPIVMAVGGDATDLIKQAEAGIICFSNDPVSMADGIEHLCQLTSIELERLGNNGKNFYESKLSLNEGVRRFITIFNEVTGSK
ncbi:glycosyltransferase family 4 protein [Buttiauxella izardii]|uniref:glycosyltransferase family 4 protein n=1 Tax=Buttiauxella izardii TaxID=82991 RepID=UPI001ABFECEE|nr:glycosyltransferase family 4 protein [Buttiauxella izardii]